MRSIGAAYFSNLNANSSESGGTGQRHFSTQSARSPACLSTYYSQRTRSWWRVSCCWDFCGGMKRVHPPHPIALWHRRRCVCELKKRTETTAVCMWMWMNTDEYGWIWMDGHHRHIGLHSRIVFQTWEPCLLNVMKLDGVSESGTHTMQNTRTQGLYLFFFTYTYIQ